MKLIWIAALASVLLSAPPAAAQPGGPGGGAPRPAPVKSIEVTPDLRLVARLRAPEANQVLFRSDYSTALSTGVPMTKGADGIWTYRSDPLQPGVWGYGFVVDGVPAYDQQNPERDLGLPGTIYSMIDVGTDTMPWVQRRAVPHGAVSVIYYHSKSLDMERRMHIYTPPGYELPENRGRRYPVLYLIHGNTQDDSSWASGGRAGFILDNLIAEGRAKPMILVMPADTARKGPDWKSPDLAGPSLTRNPFAQDMFGDIMPYVESHYRALADADSRAIAGLSAGALPSELIGFAHQDRFRYIGSFSGGMFNNDAEEYDKAHPAAFTAETNKRLKVLWFGAGMTDIAKPNTESVLKVLDRKGVKYTYWLTDGGHAWLNWRRYLNAFAPLLFR